MASQAPIRTLLHWITISGMLPPSLPPSIPLLASVIPAPTLIRFLATSLQCSLIILIGYSKIVGRLANARKKMRSCGIQY